MPMEGERILAIDPGTRYLGLAVLDGSGLLYYAVRDFRLERLGDELIRATRAVLQQLMEQYRPTVLAYEKTFYVQSKNSALLQAQEAEIKRIGREAGLRLAGYSPAAVRRALCGDGRATKDDVAALIVRRFVDLERWPLPTAPARRRYWLNMFDAIAVGVVALEEAGGGATRGSSSAATEASG
jgi:crossover junction endodeoxyribonuclease RuvC